MGTLWGNDIWLMDCFYLTPFMLLLMLILRETGCHAQLVEELVNGRHREAVFNGNNIEGVIINASAPTTILFLGEEHR